MVMKPVLALPDFTKPSSIEMDARDTSIGAVLVQGSHPVAFFSKALGVHNKKQSGKEFLTVMMVVDKWCTYLQTAPFMILIDRKCLGNWQLVTKLQRTAMSNLLGLPFTFQYKHDVENGSDNALSHVGNLLLVDTLLVWQPGWRQEVTNSYETDVSASFCQLTLCSPKKQHCSASFASTGVYGSAATSHCMLS